MWKSTKISMTKKKHEVVKSHEKENSHKHQKHCDCHGPNCQCAECEHARQTLLSQAPPPTQVAATRRNKGSRNMYRNREEDWERESEERRRRRQELYDRLKKKWDEWKRWSDEHNFTFYFFIAMLIPFVIIQYTAWKAHRKISLKTAYGDGAYLPVSVKTAEEEMADSEVGLLPPPCSSCPKDATHCSCLSQILG